MPSAKYIGYLGGAAVAAGVGAAIAVAGQGIAQAETDGSTSSAESSSESKATTNTDKADKAGRVERADKKEKAEKDPDSVDTGPRQSPANIKPKFDPADAVKELTRQFGATKPAKPAKTETEPTEVTDAEDAAEETAQTDPSPAITEPQAAPAPNPAKIFEPLSDLWTKAAEAAALLAKPHAAVEAVAADPDPDVAEPGLDVAAGPVPWSLNPFRPMPPEPAPNDMPGLIWDIEQTIVGAFDPIPLLQPLVREGYEAGFRISQMIPWVNAVIPVVNIAGQIPNLASGDPVLFRDATQSIINNLIVTLAPVSILYYGYDEVADLINLEWEAQQLKKWFYATSWDVIDFFGLLHNKGQSGLPLSASTPSSSSPAVVPNVQVVKLAAAADVTATADAPGSNPLRAEDPDPQGMPTAVLEARNLVMSILPPELKPLYREGFELAYRGSQMVPFVNAVIPATEIFPALFQALIGNKAAAQIAINALLLTTPQVSILYHGFDQIADLLNVEDAGFAAKEELYISLWNQFDPNGILHNVGESGLRSVAV